MKKTTPIFLSLMCSMLCGAGTNLMAAEESEKTIHLKIDDGQTRYASRVYELKHVTAEEILPFVNTAVKRYTANSTVRRVTANDPKAKDALLVSTGEAFLPYVDEIIKALDYAGKTGKAGSVIKGTGVSRIAYTPRYRAASQFADLINSTINSSVGMAYVNEETNTIFWRDQAESAKKTLAWIENLDRPLPQARVRLNYYEIRDSDLKDWGFDYLAWKNGPGVNLLNVGYNAGRLVIDEALSNAVGALAQYAAIGSWGFGGFFTAPQFDMSFIRCLQQSGNANIAASADLTMINTPVQSQSDYKYILDLQQQNPDKAPFLYRVSMSPEYQNIAKNLLGRSFIGKSFYEDAEGNKHADPPALEATIANPFICLPRIPGSADANGFIPYASKTSEKDMKKLQDGGVIFQYALHFKSVVERGNTGSELSNSMTCTGAATLAFGGEKVLTVYEKENDVEQTIGLPILSRIPILKYLFSTVTTIKERTYIVITAEAEVLHPEGSGMPKPVSETKNIKRRIENPFRKTQE